MRTALAATLLLLTGCAAGRAGEPAVRIDQLVVDPVLAACVATAAGLPDAASTVSDADLGAVTALHCDGQGSAAGPIRSLEGIEQLPALTNLDAPRNEIADLRPLAALPRLGTLTLTDNAVSDLSPLAGL